MSRSSFLLLGALAGLVACSDREDSSSTTGPRPSAGVSASVATATSEPKSTVCLAYEHELTVQQGILAQQPSNTDAQESVTNISAYVKENCQ